MRRLLYIPLLLFLATNPLGAHPVPFKGAVSVMTWNQPFLNETMTTYSFHRKAAVAGQYMRMDMAGGEMKAYLPQLNYLVRRWNERGAQANVYLSGGWGGYEFDPEASGDTRRKTAALGSFETDWETRKYYLSGKVTGLFPSTGRNTWVQTYRAGVAAYPAEFEELAAWLILDIQHNSAREREVTVTPVMRLFYRNILTEIGSSFSGDWMLNFMIHL